MLPLVVPQSLFITQSFGRTCWKGANELVARQFSSTFDKLPYGCLLFKLLDLNLS